MDTMGIYTEQADSVLTIRLDRPKVNAFNLPMVDVLLAALAAAEKDDAVRCVVLTGSGRFFSAGQDISDIQELGEDIPYRYHLERTYNQVVRKLRSIEKSIIGAINGPAAGAGLGIALATDIRWAAESAGFSFGFTRIEPRPTRAHRSFSQWFSVFRWQVNLPLTAGSSRRKKLIGTV